MDAITTVIVHHEVEVLEPWGLVRVDEQRHVVIVHLLRQLECVATHVRIHVLINPVRRAGVGLHDATLLIRRIAPELIEERFTDADIAAVRVPWLVWVAPKAVEVAHLWIHHWILAARPQSLDEVLKLNLVLEIVPRDAACPAVIVLAKLQVPRLGATAKGSERFAAM